MLTLAAVYWQVMTLVHCFNIQSLNFVFHAFASCLEYMNSCVNPILYLIVSPPFRRSFRRLFLGRLCRSTMRSGGHGAVESAAVQQRAMKSRPDEGAADFQRDVALTSMWPTTYYIWCDCQSVQNK